MSKVFISYSTQPTLRINLDNLCYNYEALKKRAGKTKVAASIKADAYGLGAVPVGRALYAVGCRDFFVTTAGEGRKLRNGIGPDGSIYVLNGPAPRDKDLFFRARLKPVINSMEQAHLWAGVNGSLNEPLNTAVHIDTGMNRLGFDTEEFSEFVKNQNLWQALQPDLVMSHLACAPDESHPLNKTQLNRFKKVAAQLPITTMSLANTAGIYLGKSYHFQMVRPGIGLYGGYATNKTTKEDVRPVVSLLATILQFRKISKGETLGYNASYIAPRDMCIAVVGAGYADGIPLRASNNGYATLHDQKVPIVGRVSMDLSMLDVTDVYQPKRVGGFVVFRGDQLSLEADTIGTINYELLTRLGQRCRRVYENNGVRRV